MKSYLSNRKIKVRINGVFSDTSAPDYINSSVPQGSILGPLLFLLYINDLPDDLTCTTFLYADDTSLNYPIDPNNPTAGNLVIQQDLNKITSWAKTWGMQFKPSKSYDLIFSKRGERNYCPLFLDNVQIPTTNSHKHLGFILDSKLNFTEHTNQLADKIQTLLNPMKALSWKIKSAHLNTIYSSFISPHFDYCDILYNSANKANLDKLERLHYNAALLVSGCMHGSNTMKVLNILNWQTLSSRRLERERAYMFKVVFGMAPPFIGSLFNQYRDNINRQTRMHRPFRIPANVSAKTTNSPAFQLMTVWNNLHPTTRNLQSLSQFKFRTSFKRTRVNSLSTTSIKNMNRTEEICLNRLRVDLLLPAQLYQHNFQGINPNCNFCYENYTTAHFLIKCRQPDHQLNITTLLTDLDNIAPGLTAFFQTKTIPNKCKFLLSGDPSLDHNTNCKIVQITAKFILSNY